MWLRSFERAIANKTFNHERQDLNMHFSSKFKTIFRSLQDRMNATFPFFPRLKLCTGQVVKSVF